MSRFRQALLRWLGQPEPTGVEALFTTDPLLSVTSLDPSEVGRQRIWVAAVNDTVAWLESSGWAGTPRGDLQCYAAWLLAKRAAYERQGAAIS